MRVTVWLAAISLSAFSTAFWATARAQDCGPVSDSANYRPARPSEIQVLWSRPRLTYANTTDHYASCMFMVDSDSGKVPVETYLKPRESVTHPRVSGVSGNPAKCRIYTVAPCDPEHNWQD